MRGQLTRIYFCINITCGIKQGKRLLEIVGDCWRLLEIVGGCWRLLEIVHEVNVIKSICKGMLKIENKTYQ